MIETPIQFVVNDVAYTACYVGERDGQPANRWYSAALHIFIDAPADASEANIIAAFMTEATIQEAA